MEKSSAPLKTKVIAAALSAFLGPGVGQLYNKQWKKAVILISVFILLLCAFAAYFLYAAKQAIEIMAQSNPDFLLQPGIEKTLAQKILKENARPLLFFKLGLLVLWVFGIIDAWRNAKKPLSNYHTSQD